MYTLISLLYTIITFILYIMDIVIMVYDIMDNYSCNPGVQQGFSGSEVEPRENTDETCGFHGDLMGLGSSDGHFLMGGLENWIPFKVNIEKVDLPI